MKSSDRDPLIDFLHRKMCRPCRDGDLNPGHVGCVEAAELITIVESEVG